MYGPSLDGWRKFQIGGGTKDYLVAAGIVKFWDYVADLKKKAGNAIMGVKLSITRKKQNKTWLYT